MSPREYLNGIILRPMAAAAVFPLLIWPLRAHAWAWPGFLALGAAGIFSYYAVGFLLLGDEDRLTFGRLWTALRSRLRGA